MIISRCPLRLSLCGGSTDLQAFINEYERGSVISFTPNLYTYINLNYNNDKSYRIICSKIEVTENQDSISNDIAREVIKYFKLSPVKIIFDSDIKSAGSGLAASSSYLLSMIKAVDELLQLNMSILEICKIGIEIERKFNPMTGMQDIYGCAVGGFKRIDFYKDRVDFKSLDSSILEKFDKYLVDTKLIRSSTDILSNINLLESKKLLKYVDEMETNVLNQEVFCSIINQSWEQKKKMSSLITNETIKEMDDTFKNDENVKAVRLCGAGGGGYFFLLTTKNFKLPEKYESHKIEINNEGLKSWKI